MSGGEFERWLGTLGVNEWLTLASALIAIGSLALNWIVVRKQTALQFEELRAMHDSDLIKWTDEVIEIMANAQKLCRDKDKLISIEEFRISQSEIRTRLSALLDRGRLFFPNKADADHGADKEAAFQGHRQAALNAVYGVYRVVSDVERDTAADDPVDAIVVHKRVFISEVFQTIDPRRRQSTMSALDYARARKQQKNATRE
jgi:hypothetical protein